MFSRLVAQSCRHHWKQRLGSAVLLALAAVLTLPGHAVLVSATLPGSRSVQVGDTATLFATVINAGTTPVSGCGITLASAINATSFFQTTNPTTNALTGTRNQPVDIAAGQGQTFLVGVTPNAELEPTDVAFEFGCSGETPAASFVGLNTLLLSASTTPVADIVTIALTPSGDGIAQLPKESGLGFLSLATINVGAESNLNVAARAPAGVEGALLVCETNPADGACLSVPGASVDLDIAEGGTPTFAVFASSELALPLDPAGRRLFVEFRDAGGAIRGSTSVALAGGGPDIEAKLVPAADGAVALPDGQVASQVRWILEQLAQNNSSIADIEAHFAAGSAQDWQSFFNQLRADGFSNAKLLDVLFSTPVSMGAILGTGEPGAPEGFVTVQSQYAGEGLITSFGVQPYGGTVQYQNDQNLTMEQAVADYMALGTENSLLVARINSAGQCEAIVEREADTPRALASVFKIWVLGAVAKALNEGVISMDQAIALDPNLLAQGGAINSEPAGTLFSLQDMATLMLGISDNSATDHLHALAGRARVDATVTEYGNSSPNDMLPLLSISQAFSLYRSFPLAEVRDYLDSSEAEQQAFVTERMIPLGPVLNGPFFHSELLVDAFVKGSALSVCNAFASLRGFDRHSEGFELIDGALGAAAAQPDIRTHWDRVWYKGGNLLGNNEQRVLTHAWFLESAEKGRYAVVALANNRVSGNIDTFAVQSLTSRILERLRIQVGVSP